MRSQYLNIWAPKKNRFQIPADKWPGRIIPGGCGANRGGPYYPKIGPRGNPVETGPFGDIYFLQPGLLVVGPSDAGERLGPGAL